MSNTAIIIIITMIIVVRVQDTFNQTTGNCVRTTH